MSWKSYENAAEKGPLGLLLKIGLLVIVLSVIFSVIGWGLGWFQEAGQVAQKEFGASAMLKKYEWFKDASAQLDKKRADITVYEGRMSEMKATYSDLPRQKWPREDREQFNVWSSEVAGSKPAIICWLRSIMLRW